MAFLSDFIYWLNSNILSFSDGITIPEKSFLYTFSRDLSFFSVLTLFYVLMHDMNVWYFFTAR